MNERRQIKDVIQELGLPSNSEFLGYVIHLDESDEFLMISGEAGYLWIKGMPEEAARFENPKKAEKIAKKHGKDAVVGPLFDTGDEYRFFISV